MQIWEIVPGKLWQGSLIGMVQFTADVVISCTYASELIPFNWPCHVIFPFRDVEGELPDLNMAHAIAEFAQGQADAGKRVLVNCNAGRNRSGLICGLILAYMGYTSVVKKIKEAHPQALTNQTFVDYLDGAKCRV